MVLSWLQSVPCASAPKEFLSSIPIPTAQAAHSLIENDDRIWQLDIAVNPYDRYCPHPPNTLDRVRSASAYLSTLNEQLEALIKNRERFDLCIYYAGMNPYEDCHIGGLPGVQRAILAEREHTVFAWCKGQGIPVAVGIRGGYVNPGCQCANVVDLHRLTLSAAVSNSNGRIKAKLAERHFASPASPSCLSSDFQKESEIERKQYQTSEEPEPISINH